jgi:membrane-associated phospholipid phosphatase
MHGLLEWGYDVILWLQQFSPTLDAPFKAITTLGAEQAFLLLLPLVFWCVDKRRGARLGLLLMLSTYLNYLLKGLFAQPRPLPDRVKVLAEETSPGLPSGHAQNSVAVYGFLAAKTQGPRAWGLAALIIFGVGLSRVYLGVHFPSDVLVGWLTGAVLLALYLWIEPEATYRLHRWPWRYKLALAIVAPLALFALNTNSDSAQLTGVFLGLIAGVLIEWRWVKFSAGGPLWQRGTRFAAGGVALIVVWLGTRVIFPSEPEGVALIFRLLRYTLVGLWASLGAPWFFVRAGLASRESDAWR